MHDLEVLRDKFSDAAERFPWLTHVSVTWPDDEPRQVPEPYTCNSQNLVKLWEYKIIRQKKHVVARRHWLLKPKGESWNGHATFRVLRQLSGEAVQAMRYRISEGCGQPDEIDRMFRPDFYMPGEDNYRDGMTSAEEWCIGLYWSVRDANTAVALRGANPTEQWGPVSWIEDVFSKSAEVVGTWLMQTEAAKGQPGGKEQGGQGNKATRESPSDSGAEKTTKKKRNKTKSEITKRWSRPMTKSQIVDSLKLDSVHKLNVLVQHEEYEIKEVGNNRQSWKIRIDKLDDELQKKLK